MNLQQQKELVAIHKQLATALSKTPSHSCKNCKVLAGILASVTDLHSDILQGVLKGEIRREFFGRILSVIGDAVKAYTRS